VSRRIILIAVAVAMPLLGAVGIVLLVLNGTFAEDPTTALSIVMIVIYGVIGGVLASRLPTNPIGWLFLTAGFGILCAGVASSYSEYALVTAPGSIPFGPAAAWFSNWGFVAVTALPLIVALFPTGRVASPRWRWLPPAIIATGAVAGISSMFRAIPLEITNAVTIPNPLGIPFLTPVLGVAAWVGGLGLLAMSLASVLALVFRFRSSSGDERQQLRWLVAMASLTGVFLVLTVITAIGVGNQPRTINDVMFTLFFLCLGIGIPGACATAILKYRLYDLDIVVKKTVVFTIVAVFLTVLYLAALALATVTRLGPLAGVAVFALTFNPVRRRARSFADRLVYGKRATPFEVLSEFSERLGDTYSIDDVLPRMAQLLAASTGAPEVRIWLARDHELTPMVAWPPALPPERSRPFDGETLPDMGAGVSAVPVAHQGELLGAITLRAAANDPLDASKERLLNGVASQAGLALRNVRLVEDLRASRRRIVTAQDERARTLERNIHDGAQQQLVALAVQAKVARTVAERDPAAAAQMLEQIQSSANDALENLRDLARGIYPPLLADRGLAAAIEAQARKASVPATVSADGLGRYPQEVESAVYFSVLEALTNIAKYAQASNVRIDLTQEDGLIRFHVVDDGVGFDASGSTFGTGLRGMADRLEAAGGSLQVRSEPGAGSTISGAVPFAATP